MNKKNVGCDDNIASNDNVKKNKNKIDKNKRNLGGRPKRYINWREAEKMFEAHATAQEVAAFFNIGRQTLYDRCQSDNKISLEMFSYRARAKGNLAVRLKQYAKAKKGHFSSLIWLGKQWLDQRENPIGTREPDGKLIYMVNMMKTYVKIHCDANNIPMIEGEENIFENIENIDDKENYLQNNDDELCTENKVIKPNNKE